MCRPTLGVRVRTIRPGAVDAEFAVDYWVEVEALFAVAARREVLQFSVGCTNGQSSLFKQ